MLNCTRYYHYYYYSIIMLVLCRPTLTTNYLYQSQNIDTDFHFFFKILHGVSVLQKLPELASDISSLEAQNLYSQMTNKDHYKRLAAE